MNTTNDCGIVLMTHGRQGESLFESVSHLLGETPQNVIAVAFVGTERRSEMEKHGQDAVSRLHNNCGSVLILTDLFGSTQANVAEKLAASDRQIACLHGVNLVMLLEAISMRGLPLMELKRCAAGAGKRAIISSSDKTP